jgi:hypothetical protein
MSLKHWSLLLVCALSTTLAPASAHAEDKISPEARAYFRNGVELLQTEPPNYQDAYYQFKLAFEKSQSWKVLGNLGLCAVKLERDGEAISAYDEYLRRGGKQINKDEREAIERDMLLLKGNGATLELTSKAGTLKILDSRTGSSAAPQAHEMVEGKKTLFVRAGAHRLTATGTDGRSLVWEANIEPGSTLSHDFDFDAPVADPAAAREAAAPPPVAPGAPLPSPEETRPAHNNTLITVGFVTAGVGVLGLGGGIVTGLMAKSKESNAKDKCDANKVCDPSAEPLFADARSLAKTSTVLWIGGGAVTAIGAGLVIYGYTSGKPQEKQTGSRVTLYPVLTGNAGGVFASGTF